MPARTVDPCARRVVVEHVRPTVDCGRLPAKAAIGLPLAVSADVVADGHDMLVAWVRHGAVGSRKRTEAAMAAVGNDRWEALVTPSRLGEWEFDIVGLVDA